MSTPERQPASSETVRKHKEFLFPAAATYYQEPLTLVKGKGFHVWDAQGNKCLECFGGVLTANLGHANQELTKRLRIRSIRSRARQRCFRSVRSETFIEREAHYPFAPRQGRNIS